MVVRNKELKFRAWDGKYGKKMIYFDVFSVPEETDFGQPLHELPIMQYTGLRDRNRKEIYEGDIIRIHNWTRAYKCSRCGYSSYSDAIAVVIWMDSESIYPACWAKKIVKTSGMSLGEVYLLHIDDMDKIEVIGNIYENPELIEKVKI